MLPKDSQLNNIFTLCIICHKLVEIIHETNMLVLCDIYIDFFFVLLKHHIMFHISSQALHRHYCLFYTIYLYLSIYLYRYIYIYIYRSGLCLFV